MLVVFLDSLNTCIAVLFMVLWAISSYQVMVLRKQRWIPPSLLVLICFFLFAGMAGYEASKEKSSNSDAKASQLESQLGEYWFDLANLLSNESDYYFKVAYMKAYINQYPPSSNLSMDDFKKFSELSKVSNPRLIIHLHDYLVIERQETFSVGEL